MTLAKRIIPCLDIKDGRTVKGVHFNNLIDAGDPVELSKKYAALGADELVFLDITATNENRATLYSLVQKIAENLDIPFTVGGGISSEKDVDRLLNAGADKISINSSAVKNPDLITTIANRFGSQCVVVAVDTARRNGTDYIFTHGGTKQTDIKTMDWVKEINDRGGGEILLTSMDHDGTKNGFACELTASVSELVGIPVIASGGAGEAAHFLDVFTKGKADAALAASIFHFNTVPVPELKNYLKTKNIPIR